MESLEPTHYFLLQFRIIQISYSINFSKDDFCAQNYQKISLVIMSPLIDDPVDNILPVTKFVTGKVPAHYFLLQCGRFLAGSTVPLTGKWSYCSWVGQYDSYRSSA